MTILSCHYEIVVECGEEQKDATEARIDPVPVDWEVSCGIAASARRIGVRRPDARARFGPVAAMKATGG